MKILHALFTHAKGGLGQAYVNTTHAIASKGHEVSALIHAHSPYREAVAKHAAALHTMQPVGFYDIPAAWKIRRLLDRVRPDIIVAHNARAIALLHMAARKTGIPVCGVSHSYKTPRTIRADALITLSGHMRAHFIAAGYPPEKIYVIPNLIYLPEKPVIRPPRSPVVIGAIGRFTGEKGFADLLHALQLLKATGTHFIARIGGDGPDAPQLRALADKLELAPHIRWMGWVQDQANFYRGIDILCIPSREDSFPLVVLEGLAHGVPMVATDAPGPASMLTHEMNGLVVPRGDVQALAEALERIILEPELAARLSENGLKRARDYGFESVATLWDETLKEIISASKSRQAA